MPTPTTPVLTLTKTSSSSFDAAITGTSGVTHRLFYQRLDNGSLEVGSTRVGNGTISQVGLTPFGQYLVYIVSDASGELSYPSIGFVSLVTTDSLPGAIKRRWNSFPSLSTVAGRLYLNEVPEKDSNGEEVAIPYTYADLSRTHYEFTFEREYYKYAELSFTTFCIGSDAAELAAETIKSIFDWQKLPFETARTISVMPTDEHIMSEDMRYKESSLIYRSNVCYQICVERQLTS